MAALALIPAALYAVQAISFKMYGYMCDKSKSSFALFTTLYLCFAAVLCLPFVFIMDKGEINLESIVYGIIYGVAFFGFIVLYDKAIKNGPLSVTVFVFATSAVIPIIVSAIAFKETITAFNVIGFVIVILSLYFIAFSSSHRKTTEKKQYSKSWVLYCVFGVLLNSATMVIAKFFGKNVEGGSIYQYLFMTFLVGAFLSLGLYIPKETRLGMKSVGVDKWFVILAVAVAVSSAVGNGLVAELGKILDGAVLFPIVSSVSIGISSIVSIFLFEEKLNAKGILGLILGIIAIVLLSI